MKKINRIYNNSKQSLIIMVIHTDTFIIRLQEILILSSRTLLNIIMSIYNDNNNDVNKYKYTEFINSFFCLFVIFKFFSILKLLK